MRKFSRYFLHLPVQLAVFLIGLTALTAAAIGLPALWAARAQMEQQALRRVEQGGRLVEAGLSAGLSDLSRLALLTAQRPTLHALLETGSPETLQAYLDVLQSGSGLDYLLVCRGSVPLAAAPAGRPVLAGLCLESDEAHLRGVEGMDPPGWMLAGQSIDTLPGGHRVTVGRALDTALIDRLRLQLDMEIALLIGGEYVAGSFDNQAQAAEALRSGSLATGAAGELLVGDERFHAQHVALDGGVEIVAALSTREIRAAQAELQRSIGLGILGVTLAASLMAYYLAMRLSRPLERLRAAAVKLRQGDLSTPVGTRSKVREIAQVAVALEDARSVLQHSLNALRREKEWSDHLLSSVVEGIVTIDRNGRITFFSQGAERISGWQRQAAFGKHIDQVFQPAPGDQGGDPPPFSRSLPEAGGRPALLEVQALGRRITLAVTMAQLAPPEAGRTGAALVLRDVTDEDAIRRLLGDFLANITHEFRTPLSALAASIELMLDQLPQLSPDELRELLGSLRLGTLSLQTLIDNLLEGASIEAGRFRVHPRPAEVNEVIHEAAATMQPLVEKYGQRLTLRVPEGLPPVRVDPRRTGQVLVNLLSNAVKWSPPGAEIVLEAAPEIGAVRITVGDCGPGIPEEQLADVFTRFAHLQIDDPRAGYGAGLGLSVVKAIVEAQGGKVGVEDRPAGGAAFWFTAPEAG